jgi:hypothetical protein
MRLSSISRNHRTSGEIINLMAVDVERVIDFLWWIHDIWDLPLQVCLALAILYTNVGLAAAVAALIATIATVLFNVPVAALQRRFQEQLMGAKDARMKTTSECLRNMRILKLQVRILTGCLFIISSFHRFQSEGSGGSLGSCHHLNLQSI